MFLLNQLNKGYRLYLDNWCTSPELVDMLNDLQTDCTGTVRQAQKGVPDVTKKNQNQGKGKLSEEKMLLNWNN